MRNDHDKARELIALGDALSQSEQGWLRAHIEECELCREYGDRVNGMLRALRSTPVTADARLVRATQMRVRFHANRLREIRQRMWLVGLSCLGVGLSATFTAPLMWRLFAWLGEQAGVSSVVWQAAFAFFWIVPVLVVSVLLMARGTHLASDGGRSQDGK
jgi:predicted anti-sigma-YlaC factor YlaD